MITRERGNILFLILLAVVLFGALSYAVTSSTRGGGNDASKEKGQAQAADLLNYFAQMSAATQRMLLAGGVKDYELNFYLTSMPHKYLYGANDNTNCVDNRCRVFDPAGGGVSGRELEPYTRNNLTNPERVLYVSVPGAGTSAPDIVFSLHGASYSICREVNARAGISDVIYNSGAPTNDSTLMYQFALPVGPIPDLGRSVAGVTSNQGVAGTLCTCAGANQAACDADQFQPVLLHVLVAR